MKKIKRIRPNTKLSFARATRMKVVQKNNTLTAISSKQDSPAKIKLFKVHQPPHNRYLEETMKSGFYAEGPRTAEFEAKMGEIVGNPMALAINSGTSALFLALYLAGVKPGKMVITTPITSPATNISIPRLGGQILWADVDKASGNISAKSVGRLLDKFKDKVAAVIAVDWGGMPCDFDELKKTIKNRALLIDDAAHALGAIYKGKPIGSHADFTCFSFQAIKHITTGDGGLLTCVKEDVYRRAKRLRWFGIDRAKPNRSFGDDLLEAGFKFHMNDIAASIGLAQLEDLPQTLKRRREIAKYYEDNLLDYAWQKTSYDCQSAYWLFTVKIDNREDIMKKMSEAGVDVSPVHCRNDVYTAFRDCAAGKDDLINTAEFDQKMLCLPVGEWLSDKDSEYIVSKLKEFSR